MAERTAASATPVLFGGCALASSGACLEGGAPDADCCAAPGNGSCAEGYVYEPAGVCAGGKAAVSSCCTKIPSPCAVSACRQASSCNKTAVVLPTTERDLCKATLLARSLAIHDPHGLLGDFYLAWVSEQDPRRFRGQLSALERALPRDDRAFHLLDFSPDLQVVNGWTAQMVVKLKMAAVVNSDYYLILDSQNALISDIEKETLFQDGDARARLFGDPLEVLAGAEPLHACWYRDAARTLGVPLSTTALYPLSITPALLHRPTALELLAHLGERTNGTGLCDGPLCGILGGWRGTELTLYQLFASAKGDYLCIHHPEQRRGARQLLSLGMWSEHNVSLDLSRCRLALEGHLLTFGVQAGALRDKPAQAKWWGSKWDQLQDCIMKVYTKAGLFNTSAENVDNFLGCID